MKLSVITPTIRPESLAIMRDCLKEQTFRDFEWLIDVNVTGEHDLNASFNKLIKRSEGELIVFYEDFTKISPQGLQKFWDAYQEYPDTCFTSPLGKVNEWGENAVWDWRAYKQNESQENYTDCMWNTCELDWGAIPKKILVYIGGFDEELDKWWSMDNVSVGKRANILGYKFKCLFTNPAIAYDHDAHIEHPFRKRYNSQEANIRMDTYHENPKLPFLS